MARTQSTHYAHKIERAQHTLDATGEPLGRLASTIAALLLGKHKATYAPHRDMGDAVTVMHAAQVTYTGKKIEQKNYIRHTGHPGGLRIKKIQDVVAQDPGSTIRRAVSRMLPAKKFKKDMLKRLIVNA